MTPISPPNSDDAMEDALRSPLPEITPEAFRARRDALRAACPDRLILLRGATEDEAAFGVGGVYCQNSVFYYFTGVETPGAFLALLPDKVAAPTGLRGVRADAREVLFLPARNPVTEAWTGSKLGPGSEAEQTTGVAIVADAERFESAVTMWLRRSPVCGVIAPYGENALQSRQYRLMQRIGALAPIVQFRDVSLAVARLQTVKSPEEVAYLQRAVAVTVAGQRAAQAVIANGAGRSEFEVEAALMAAFRGHGARAAFPPIVGAGRNGTVLHYEANEQTLQTGDLVVVDIGARVGHYNGDLTRTYAVDGSLNARQAEIYALVSQAHAHLVVSYQPGTDTLFSLDARCKAFLRASPLRARDAEGIERTMDVFMPHRVGHHLGLEVHDLSGLIGGGVLDIPDDLDQSPPLPPGSVFTLEPGVYLADEGIGVRLEDNYLATETGLERLGPPLPFD